ncbi:MAG: Smr/MutS family protein [Gammaproteobacteria bacterium]
MTPTRVPDPPGDERRTGRARPLAAAASEPSAEERALFRAATKDVRRLTSDTLTLRAPPPRPRPRPVVDDLPGSTLAEASPAELDHADHLAFKRVGLQPAHWRRLQRGEYALEETLDLHGMTIAEARAALSGFLRHCVAGGRRCVRIVHGKGYRSPDHSAVLKPRVAYWLAHASDVVAYASARPADGGTGALYVLLKRARG